MVSTFPWYHQPSHPSSAAVKNSDSAPQWHCISAHSWKWDKSRWFDCLPPKHNITHNLALHFNIKSDCTFFHHLLLDVVCWLLCNANTYNMLNLTLDNNGITKLAVVKSKVWVCGCAAKSPAFLMMFAPTFCQNSINIFFIKVHKISKQSQCQSSCLLYKYTCWTFPCFLRSRVP